VLPSDDSGVNAVRVVLEKEGPLYFGKIFTDEDHIDLTRPALASRTGGASFALDSNILRLDGTVLNDALIEQFGINASISVGDMDVLDSSDINLGTLLETLSSIAGVTSTNPADILNAEVEVGDLVAALQANLPDSVSGSLDALRSAAGTATIDVSAVVGGLDTELGLTATDFLDEVSLSALDIVRATATTDAIASGINLDTAVNVPNVASVTADLSLGEPPVESGWIAIGEEGTQLNRAAIRLRTEVDLEVGVLSGLPVGLSVASVHVPLYAEVAGATATLEEISCDKSSGEAVAARFTTGITELDPSNGTSVAALYLGDLPDEWTGPVDPDDLDYADLVSVDIEVNLLLTSIKLAGITIQGRSAVTVGASNTETISFSHDDVANGNTTKYFGSGDLLSSAVSSLLSSDTMDLRIKPSDESVLSGLSSLVLGIVDPLLDALMAALPGQLLSPVDGVLDSLLAGLGLNLGEGELTLTGHHCERLQLVR